MNSYNLLICIFSCNWCLLIPHNKAVSLPLILLYLLALDPSFLLKTAALLTTCGVFIISLVVVNKSIKLTVYREYFNNQHLQLSTGNYDMYHCVYGMLQKRV
jgi:membrane protein YdbS with pleckstrin-like domain